MRTIPIPIHTLHRGFELVNTYARLNLKAEAAKTYLGYLWWVVEPLLYVIIFYFVFSYVLANPRADFLPFHTAAVVAKARCRGYGPA